MTKEGTVPGGTEELSQEILSQCSVELASPRQGPLCPHHLSTRAPGSGQCAVSQEGERL